MASYIDKDIAVSIVRLCFAEHGKFETHSSLMNFICTSLSADVTTADVKPVVHAHRVHDFIDADWNCGVEIHCGWVCSNCNWYAEMESKTKYCPHCGAIMDEEVE